MTKISPHVGISEVCSIVTRLDRCLRGAHDLQDSCGCVCAKVETSASISIDFFSERQTRDETESGIEKRIEEQVSRAGQAAEKGLNLDAEPERRPQGPMAKV
jgi:hypothetical protein